MTAILFGLLAKYLRGQKLFGTRAFALVAPNVNVREYDAWPHMPPRCHGRLSRVDDRPWTMDWLVRGGLEHAVDLPPMFGNMIGWVITPDS